MPFTAPDTDAVPPDRRHARPPTVVGVVLATPTPEAWVVALLERVEAHLGLALRVAFADGEASTGAPPPEGVDTRLARRLLRSSLADAPRFGGGARRPTPLPESILGRRRSLDDLAGASDARPTVGPRSGAVDVLLDVGVRVPALERRLPPDTRLWTAGVEHLERRVERALLARAPLFHLHVFERTAGEPNARPRVLGTHALPRQSFSITDLVGAAFRSLPGVLVARLGWLAAGREPRDVEEASLPGADGERDVGDERVFRSERGAVLRDAGAHAARPPRPITLRATLALVAHRNRSRLVNRLGEERWQLAVLDARGSDPLALLATRDPDDWRALEPPADRIWADPHLIAEAGETHLFLEELVDGEPCARIVAARLDACGDLLDTPRPVLVEPFHLSYPFVFAHDGSHWMLPETASRRTVSLYRATRFPDTWEHVRDLLIDVDLADGTLHRHDGRWWLFANRFTDRVVDERDELLIHFADSLDGPWHPHALNPVVTGVDRARMAGPVFEENGVRYRPSQYGAVRYGHGINLSRIDVLTPEAYRETPIRRLLPRPGSRWLGCHSLAIANGLVVIDRIDRRRRW